jgi:hypothetical protein
MGSKETLQREGAQGTKRANRLIKQVTTANSSRNGSTDDQDHCNLVNLDGSWEPPGSVSVEGSADDQEHRNLVNLDGSWESPGNVFMGGSADDQERLTRMDFMPEG